METSKSMLQLHVYLDKDSVCIRSYVECDTPYFEVDAPYDSKTQTFLAALIHEEMNEEMDEKLSPFFYGVNQKLMNSKIICTINDCRTPSNSSRTFVFKNKHHEKNYEFITHPNENQNSN